jgi:hypothetical protein
MRRSAAFRGRTCAACRKGKIRAPAPTPQMLRYHNKKIPASDPIPIRLSDEKLRLLHPELYGSRASAVKLRMGKHLLNAAQTRLMLAEHLSFGDSRAAIVILVEPLIVAAYTDEQDAVLLLRFPDFLADSYCLTRCSKLITTNTYGKGSRMAADIIPGPASTGRWTNFYPIIADFLSDDLQLISRRKSAISESEWRRTTHFAEEALLRPQVLIRDGRPLRSAREGTPLA